MTRVWLLISSAASFSGNVAMSLEVKLSAAPSEERRPHDEAASERREPSMKARPERAK